MAHPMANRKTLHFAIIFKLYFILNSADFAILKWRAIHYRAKECNQIEKFETENDSRAEQPKQRGSEWESVDQHETNEMEYIFTVSKKRGK